MVDEAGHYPYQAQIEAYGNLGFRFAGMSHRGSLLCLPTGMFEWKVNSASEVTLESLAPILALTEDVDVCFIGLGMEISVLDPAIRQAFREKNIIVEAISTGSAVRTYNILLAEKRAVCAALIAVEHVR